MPISSGLLTTANTYTQANTVICPGTVLINLHVFNAGIWFAVGNSPVVGGAQLTAEIFRGPGLYSMDRKIAQIAVRSAVAGTPATVSIDTWRAGEL